MKGSWFYEVQIGPLVLQWRHSKGVQMRRFHIGPFQVWRDSAWKLR